MLMDLSVPMAGLPTPEVCVLRRLSVIVNITPAEMLISNMAIHFFYSLLQYEIVYRTLSFCLNSISSV